MNQQLLTFGNLKKKIAVFQFLDRYKKSEGKGGGVNSQKRYTATCAYAYFKSRPRQILHFVNFGFVFI